METTILAEYFHDAYRIVTYRNNTSGRCGYTMYDTAGDIYAQGDTTEECQPETTIQRHWRLVLASCQVYDIEVRLTQGWAAIAHDLADELDAIITLHQMQQRGHIARIVPHIATV